MIRIILYTFFCNVFLSLVILSTIAHMWFIPCHCCVDRRVWIRPPYTVLVDGQVGEFPFFAMMTIIVKDTLECVSWCIGVISVQRRFLIFFTS